jgi:acetyl/propionyl-CoA carboxylase alpha subunit
VTELVSGVDIVREQLRLAAGRPLSDGVLAAAARAHEPGRHAIEVRIAAEDPGHDFGPTPGLIRRWHMPSGPGVRVDSAIEAGERVPAEYDNLIAKVLVEAPDRDGAIGRLGRALDEIEIAGVQTTLPFHRFVARDAAFRAGRLSTGWVAEHWDGAAAFARAERLARLAAGLAATAPAAPDGFAAPAMLAPGEPRAERNGVRAGADGPGWAEAALLAATDRWPA